MKVAVSIPDSVFDAAERLAKQRVIPRSRLFTEALEEYVLRHGGQAVTDQLNNVYAAQDAGVEESLVHAQLGSIPHEAW